MRHAVLVCSNKCKGVLTKIGQGLGFPQPPIRAKMGALSFQLAENLSAMIALSCSLLKKL